MSPLSPTAGARVPVTVIAPPRGWARLDFGELWEFRELFGFLVWRDIKVMYKQTLLGAAWAILVPFTQMVVFTLIFGQLAGLASDGLPGPLFYYAGLLPWTYFSQSLTMASASLVGGQALLTKVYFPRLIIPASACVTPMINFAIAFVILVVMMLWYRVVPSAAALLLPALLLMAFATALGVGLFLSALNVKYRDVKYTVPFLVQIWMYITVILPFSEFEALGPWRWLYGLNPMGSVVEAFRWCLFHAHPGFGVERATEGAAVLAPVAAPWPLLLISLPVTLALLAGGLYYFRRMENQFADIV